MKVTGIALGAAVLAALAAAGAARAQLVERPELQSEKPVQAAPFLRLTPSSRSYMSNDAPPPDPLLFGDYRVDPKLVAGFSFSEQFAVETGYMNLLSRGFHYADPGRADERAGALGTRGFASYLAGKYTVPVTGRLETFGKLGIAYSERLQHGRGGVSLSDADAGPYVGVGAKYRLNDKATLSGELEQYGDTARKWGNATNASGLKAKLKLGF